MMFGLQTSAFAQAADRAAVQAKARKIDELMTLYYSQWIGVGRRKGPKLGEMGRSITGILYGKNYGLPKASEAVK
jgi:hypothetical protein